MTERVCRHLRWRDLSGATAGSGERLLHALSMGGPFTCARTCQPWGPDDDIAVPERCGGDRPCCTLPPPDPAT